MAIAAEIPDLDIFTQLGGPVYGFQHHRGFTHSFVGLPLDAAGALLIVREGVVLDIDRVTLALLVGLILPSLFALIQEEIGAKRTHGRGGAIFALLVVSLVWGGRDYEHRRAVAAASALEYGEQLPLRVSAFPYMTNPFQWYAVIETETAFHQMDVDSMTPEVDPRRRARIHYKPAETAVSEAAKKSYLGRVYLDWADYPIVEVQKLAPGQDIGEGQLERLTWQGAPDGSDGEASSGGYLVRLIDLRYAYPGRQRVLRAAVQLDANDKVVAFYFGLRREKAN